MKKNTFLIIVVALLLAGCTTETDMKSTNKITRISVDASDKNVDTRTATNDQSVTWVAGDEIALFKEGDRSGYKRFRLTSTPGTNSGYFEGVTESDYLTEGDNYKVIYPYGAAAKTGTNNGTRLAIYEIGQNEETNTHLATYDWLESTYRTVTATNPVPAFKLNHSFAFLKVTLDVEGADENNGDYDEYLNNLTISTTDNSAVFAQRVFLNSNINAEIVSYGIQTVAFRSPKTWLANGKYTFWHIVQQDASAGVKDLSFTVFFSHGESGSTLWSVGTTYSPQSVLKSGSMYRINLKAIINGASRTGRLELVSVN